MPEQPMELDPEMTAVLDAIREQQGLDPGRIHEVTLDGISQAPLPLRRQYAAWAFQL
ncbi:hypothetical protein QWY79_12190 [Halomonas sabkhae]|uniref:hypothetical protein n=1 Tax=Halomonas sabkhae TaxID=626223 RepID=UPI0025B6233D|nr:hypothetical protein [Halomonas sabkhae]MDN3526024.1 hypothetical protein [Halomonas sabkhae]